MTRRTLEGGPYVSIAALGSGHLLPFGACFEYGGHGSYTSAEYSCQTSSVDEDQELQEEKASSTLAQRNQRATRAFRSDGGGYRALDPRLTPAPFFPAPQPLRMLAMRRPSI
jgi:hypothetical protein